MLPRLFLRSIIFTAVFTLSIASAHAAAVSWVGTNGDWETGANWSSGVQPTDADDVTIDASVTVNVNAATTVNSLTVGSSTGGTTPSLVFDYDALTSGALTIDAGDLSVHPNASVTHTVGTSAVVGSIYFNIQTGGVTVHPNGSIHANEKGYAGGEGTGQGLDAVGASGGGYGGTGGSGWNSSTDVGNAGGITYGSITAPVDLGSGGGMFSGSGKAGGGAIRITAAGTVTVNGTLSSNGGSDQDITAVARGGGSGGSIYLNVGTLAGTGVVTANGGGGNLEAAGGGGGRIALYYTTDSSGFASLGAFGGSEDKSGTVATHAVLGGAGTLYKKAASAPNGDLIIDNNYSDPSEDDLFMGKTPLAGSQTYDTLTVRGRGHLLLNSDSSISYTSLSWSSSGSIEDNSAAAFALFTGGGELTVPATARYYANTARTFTTGSVSGMITHNANYLTADRRLNLTFTTLTIEPEGSINVNEKGFYQGAGPGEGLNGANGPTGGGYGGYSGSGVSSSQIPIPGSITYGDLTAPTDLGSGGGISTTGLIGSDGGGAVQVTVTGTLTLNGSISANGETLIDSSSSSRSGGSGGSVYITTGTLAGAGNITADGGAGNVDGSAGGGGRIAIYYTTDSSTLGILSAYGGVADTSGANTTTRFITGGAGTIYKKAAANTYGDLIIDNNYQDPVQDDLFMGKTPVTGTYTFNTLTVQHLGHMVLYPDSNLSYSTLNWSSSGVIEDNNAGTFALVTSGGALEIPVTARLYAHAARTFTTGTIDGVLTHGTNYTAQDYRINLTFSSLTLNPNSEVNVSGKGFFQGEGTGAGTDNDNGPGGGGYGGTGGSGVVSVLSGKAGGVSYGSITAPTDVGSGGGISNNLGTKGGGAIQLTVANALVVNGNIRANGQSGDVASAVDYSGGSGGSIYVDAGTISGTGRVVALGGNSNEEGGAGGGGRIAAFFETDNSVLTEITAYGGTHETSSKPNFGGAGTIYLKADADTYGDLLLKNNNLDDGNDDRWHGKTFLTGISNVDVLALSDKGNLEITSDTNLSYYTLTWSEGIITDNGGTFALVSGGGDILIPSAAKLVANTPRSFTSVVLNGTLTHSENAFAEDHKIYLTTTGNFSITGGGRIDVDDLGFYLGSGTGAGADAGTYGSGAGHGGTGGVTTDVSSTGGLTYDTEAGPVHLGSGGGASTARGGEGGGAVYLGIGGNMTLGGEITASAETTAPGSDAGGGSGGSIWLNITGTLSGTGNIYAKGGSGSISNAGAGSGGRIAINCTSYTWTGTGDVTAGGQGQTADTGTIYTSSCPQGSNVAPSLSTVLASQVADGTGDVIFSFLIDDADDENTLQAKVEYDVGSGFEDATIAVLDANTTATYGDPDVDNSNSYQLGTAAGYIFTSTGENRVVSYWKSGIDEPTADLSTAVLRITPFDGTAEGTSSSSANFSVDNVSPTTPSLTYNTSTTANSETITGTTSANAYIFSNGNLVAQADGSGNFSYTVNLKAGVNLYLVRAVDNKLNVSAFTLVHIRTPGPDSSGSQTTVVEESMAGEEELTPEELAELEEELIPDEEEIPDEVTEEIPEESAEETPGPSIPEAVKDKIKDKIIEQIKDKLKNNPQVGIQGIKQAISNLFGNGGTTAFEPAIKPKKPPQFTDKIFESKELGDADSHDVPEVIIEKYFDTQQNFEANADADGDSVTNEQELLYGANPFESDSDSDGLSDDLELLAGTELFNWDSDGDGLSDSNEAEGEASSYNSPEVSAAEVASYIASNDIDLEVGETLSLVDSDEDGISDLQELEIDTDPLSADSDQDGYDDGEELINYGTDPNTASRPQGAAISNADVDQLLEEGNQFFMGRGEPNSELEVYAVDTLGMSVLIGTTVVDAEGKFAVYTDPLEQGVYELLLKQSDGREVTDLSYPLTLMVSGNDLLEEPVLKRLGGKLLFSNTTVVAEWTDVLLGSEALNSGQSLLGSGVQLIAGQASEPGRTVVLKALRESGEEYFLGQTLSDAKGKYTMFVDLPTEEAFTVYAYTMDGDRILDTSLPLLFNLQSTHGELAERLDQGGTLVLDNRSPILDSIAVEEDTAILTTWQSLVLSNTLVTDSVGQEFQAEVPEPLEPGRHAVTVYAVDRATGERSKPVQVEFDVVTAGVVAPAVSDAKQNSPWMIFAVAGAVLFGLMGFAAFRRLK